MPETHLPHWVPHPQEGAGPLHRPSPSNTTLLSARILHALWPSQCISGLSVRYTPESLLRAKRHLLEDTLSWWKLSLFIQVLMARGSQGIAHNLEKQANSEINSSQLGTGETVCVTV